MRRDYIHGRTFNGVYYNWDPWRGKGPVRCRALKRAMERYYILEMPPRFEEEIIQA